MLLVTADIDKFRTSLTANGSLFKFDVTDGQLTEADQVGTP